MPLPNPDYLSVENVNWNGDTANAILIDITATYNQLALWDSLTEKNQTIVHDVISAYGVKLGIVAEADYLTWPGSPPAPIAGWQVMDYQGSVVGGNPTGLANDSTTYTITVVIDGTPVVVSVVGSAAQTFTTLVSEITTDLAAAGTASIENGNIEITSGTTGLGSTVKAEQDNLFKRTNGFARLGTKAANTRFDGYDSLKQLFDESFVGLKSGQKNLTFKPTIPSGPFNRELIYFDHDTSSWKYIYNDGAVV